MVKVAIFSSSPYVRRQMEPLLQAHPGSFHIDVGCNLSTAALCQGAEAVCLFASDEASHDVIEVFHEYGVKLILLRCPEMYVINLRAAEEFCIKILKVPGYSEHAVAEHAVALSMALNRRLVRCYERVNANNFNLGGLCGIDFHGKTIGIIGVGKVGTVAARIFKALGMRLVAWDPFNREAVAALGGTHVEEIDDLYKEADVISLHVPLTNSTRHMINQESISIMKRGVLIINTARGHVVHTPSIINGLRSGQLGGVALDVYEEEGSLFNQDRSEYSDEERIKYWDFQFATLRSFPNTVITPHSAFLTTESLKMVCNSMLSNLKEYEMGGPYTWELHRW
mmetsp:Transcript_28273/g.61740  ORF Transcript_28273/g.61740 Transcript_28273/m.61740 type:complete len:339 (-) Transcript_28273:363-1379(-)